MPRLPAPERLAAVYFVQIVPDGLIKIGWSRNVWARLYSVQQGCPADLQVLGVLPATREDEVAIQDRFRNLRVRGEWHTPGAPIFTFLREATQRLRPSPSIARLRKGPVPLVMPDEDACKIWLDNSLTKGEKLRLMTGWIARTAVQAFGPCPRPLVNGLPTSIARANGSKGGRPKAAREMRVEDARREWFSRKHATDAVALDHMPSWNKSLAYRAFGKSGRVQPGRPRQPKK